MRAAVQRAGDHEPDEEAAQQSSLLMCFPITSDLKRVYKKGGPLTVFHYSFRLSGKLPECRRVLHVNTAAARRPDGCRLARQ